MFISFIAILAVLLNSDIESIASLALLNGGIQILFFICVACIPLWRTGRMSYVDLAWPFGVAIIGALVLLFAEGDWMRKTIVGSIYLTIGLRMGIGALVMAFTTGIIFKKEFPRYKYRQIIFEQQGTQRAGLHKQVEVMVQGLANASVLALPALIISANSTATLSILEIIGFSLWGVAFLIESAADSQKLLFIAKNPKGVCNIGLWRFSRHPNYFAEWLVWCGLAIATIPSWLLMQNNESPLVWLVSGAGVIGACVTMYITLVYLTGAKPAEYFSVQKRAAYADYQKTTNIFFPWPPKK